MKTIESSTSGPTMLFAKLNSFARSLAAVWVILVCISYQALRDWTVLISFLPPAVTVLIASFLASPIVLFLPSIGIALLGVLGASVSSYINLFVTVIQSFWPENPTAFGLTEFVVTVLATGYKAVFYPFPFIITEFIPAPLPKEGSILNVILRAIFKDQCAHYPPDEYQLKNASVKDETWIYCNGMVTNFEIANENRKLLVDMFGRPIHMLHNPTDGFILDLIECVAGKTGLFQFGIIEPREELKKLLRYKLIEAKEKGIKKVVLVCHSQGTIITGNVLSILASDPQIAPIMKELLEVYSFATCGHKMPGNKVKYLENLSNKGDVVAYLGQFFPFPKFWDDVEGDGIEISGKCLAEDDSWGHLLNSHYLLPMLKDGKYAKSKLMTEYFPQRKSNNTPPPTAASSAEKMIKSS